MAGETPGELETENRVPSMNTHKLSSTAGLAIRHLNIESCILMGELDVKQGTKSEGQIREKDK